MNLLCSPPPPFLLRSFCVSPTPSHTHTHTHTHTHIHQPSPYSLVMLESITIYVKETSLPTHWSCWRGLCTASFGDPFLEHRREALFGFGHWFVCRGRLSWRRTVTWWRKPPELASFAALQIASVSALSASGWGMSKPMNKPGN